MISLIQMYGSFTGGVENALASMDVPQDGNLLEAVMNFAPILDADDEGVSAQLSFLSTHQFAVNDARGAILTVDTRVALTTSGAAVGGLMARIDLRPGLPIMAGERMYLHTSGSAGVSGNLYVMLAFDWKDTRRARMRRR